MKAPEVDEIVAHWAQSVSRGATAQQIALAVATASDDIDHALAPVVGLNGVAALYKRTLHVAGKAHPCLLASAFSGSPSDHAAAWTTALQGQTASQAVAAGAAFLQTFHQLLVTLVGLSLAERLLRPVWANILSGSSAKDTEA